ncbi:MAG: aconitase X catalytic domain-containing protein [Clostridia bacterium]|nr:aconitase X catalytic domain-containing protein [Clostridia bacterium]
MKLTDYEKRVLEGEEGKLKQTAMKVIVQYAEVLGAEQLCEVTKAHLFCGAHPYLEVFKSSDIDEVISEMCFCSADKICLDKMACYCQSDCGPMDTINWGKMWVTYEEYKKNMEYLKRYLNAGVNLVGSCIPYLVGFMPLMGEHYVTSESHAVLMLNSVLGACGNADGIEIGFCAAVSGRIPYWGNHIMDNRMGTHVFKINCKTDTVSDWDLLGYTIGRLLPTHSIPIIDGNFNRPDVTKLKSCYASMATTSGAEMCHIVGITPEALTLGQALGGNQPKEVVVVTDRDIYYSFEQLNSGGRGDIEYISLGCPHYTIEEIRQVAAFLDGKRVSSNVCLHVWTASPIKETADRCGYTEIIEGAGGVVLTSSCPLTSEKKPEGINGIAFDSAKQAHYIIPGTSAKVYYGTPMDCLKSAITGKWEGR